MCAYDIVCTMVGNYIFPNNMYTCTLFGNTRDNYHELFNFGKSLCYYASLLIRNDHG